MSIEKTNNQKKDNKFPNIISLGSSLNLELTLALEEKQYELIGIKYKEISKLEDLYSLCPQSPLSSLRIQKLTSLIELQSNNFLFNSILFINQSCKKKLPIKYLIPFSPKFPKELIFVYDIIKIITEKNNIYIEDSNLLDIKPNIIFTLKLIENENVTDQKSFLITNENHYNNKIIDENKKNENLEENEYNGQLFEGLNFEYDCDYFYSSINELFNCKKNSENEIEEFIKTLNNKYPDVKICINYDENYLLNNKDFIKYLLENTDIFIFEKKDVINFYNSLFSSNNNDEQKVENKDNINIIKRKNILEEFFIYNIKSEKIKKLIKIGIFINEMKDIFLLQQDPKTKLILYQTNHDINIIPTDSTENEKNNYNELIKVKYNSLKSVYIGAFLNRLIRQESFEICLKTSLKCTSKYFDILKFGLDVPNIQNYYELKNAKNPKKKINKEEIKNRQLENKFILDCTNVNNKIKNYNSLFDDNCINFFNSKETRKLLQRQGFINKKGMILVDPEKNNKFITMSKKEKKDIYKKFQLKLNNIKEIRQNNYKRKEKLCQISLINQEALKHYSFKDFDSINNENSNSHRHFYLPKIKNKIKINMNKTPNIFKKRFENLYGENNKEDNKKSLIKRKKNLSEMDFMTKVKILHPFKTNRKSFNET